MQVDTHFFPPCPLLTQQTTKKNVRAFVAQDGERLKKKKTDLSKVITPEYFSSRVYVCVCVCFPWQHPFVFVNPGIWFVFLIILFPSSSFSVSLSLQKKKKKQI